MIEIDVLNYLTQPYVKVAKHEAYVSYKEMIDILVPTLKQEINQKLTRLPPF